MSDVQQPAPQKKCKPARRQCSIYQVHYGLQKQVEETAKPLPRPMDSLDIQQYGLQVAGHMKTENQKYQGVLQCNNGTILKPIIKETQKREVDFYETLKSSNNPDLVELRSFTAKYDGCRKFTYNGYEQDYIVLQDLAAGMLEPCIMDVKIGRRTWDPLASPEKIVSEQSKYALCKEQFGFCIPGYQVHKVCSGRLYKYGKDCGKKLHGTLVKGGKYWQDTLVEDLSL
ncbi:inositol polyphosphate multikinase [Hyposmocoma kahamanoa]|uniref:inositol polyphosphate multikinase n=1 Tax=Hyposmocoma kahamanoa TaxID=1477025 RepID=UPI000E6D920D|nr:inositol polyphosphate multikinase [Hyposmocoma kahamanoa]